VSWARIDDNAPLHPKLLRAGPEACWLWVCGLAWAGRNRKAAGKIPRDVLHSLYPGAWTAKRIEQLAARLVSVGLWEQGEQHFTIHDLPDYGPGGDGGNGRHTPKSDAERARDARARKKAASRDASRDGPSDGARDDGRDASRDAERDVTSSRVDAPAPARAHPVPSRPIPSEGENGPAPQRDAPAPSEPLAKPMPLAPTLARIYGEQREEKIPVPYEHFHRDRVAWDTAARAIAAYAAKRSVPSDDVATRVIANYLAIEDLRAEAWPPRWFADRIDGLLLELAEPSARPDGSYPEVA
jgi:hypothetical protein